MLQSVSGSFVVLTLLGACGGNGSDDAVDRAFIETLATRAFSADAADPMELPAEATLSGFIAIEVDAGLIAGPIIGDMDMVADFGSGTLETPVGDIFLSPIYAADGALIVAE